jgi:NADH:ubiquinone oxidoreductase subunit C
VNGADVDTVFVLNEVKSNENEATTFDETLQQLKHDPTALNNHIIDVLETQIKGNLKDDILYCRKVQALFPVIYILFNDRTKVEIAVQIKTNENKSEDTSSFHDAVTGVR